MPKTISGIVSSDKADKTIVVRVATRMTHPIYKKQYTRTVKLMAHDPNNEAKAGDHVLIVETRPISARKRFKLERIVTKSGVRFEERDAVSDIPEEEIPEKPELKPKAKAEKTEKKETPAKESK